jgi:hypothetical protein
MARQAISTPPVPSAAATRQATIVLRSLGVFAGGLGLYVGCDAIRGLIWDVANVRSTGAFGFVFSLLMASFAVWCLVACYRTWRPAKVWTPARRVTSADGFFSHSKVPPVRSVSAILCICLFCVAGMWLEGSSSPFFGLTDHAWKYLSTLVAATLACAVYIGLTWWLSSALAIPYPPPRMPQFMILIFCFLLWVTAFAVLEEVSPKERGRFSPPRYPWNLVVLVVPFAVAMLVSKVLNRVATRHRPWTRHAEWPK